MPWRKSSEARKTGRVAVVAVFQELGIPVDQKGNVRDGDLMIGSLDSEGNFSHPVLYRRMPLVVDVRKRVRRMGRTNASSKNWKPNP